MDRFGRPTLTRPATPQAFKVSPGRYSHITPKQEDVEVVKVPAHLLVDVVNTPGTK